MPYAHYYVDASIGNDDLATGRGESPGDPWATYEHAVTALGTLSQTTQVNIKGTQSITATQPMPGGMSFSRVFAIRGYTSVANDGGLFTFDMQGNSNPIIDTTATGLHIADGDFLNTGAAAYAVRFQQYSAAANIYVAGGDGDGIRLGGSSSAICCGVENMGGYGIYADSSNGRVMGCWLKNGASNKFSYAIGLGGSGSLAVGNMVAIDGSSVGIWQYSFPGYVEGNSIIGMGTGTPTGILWNNNALGGILASNVLDGLNIGINSSISNRYGILYGHNAFGNNTTDVSGAVSDVFTVEKSNEFLGATAIIGRTGSNAFRSHEGYWGLNDVGTVRTNGYGPGRSIGAVHHQGSGGGGSPSVSGYSLARLVQ